MSECPTCGAAVHVYRDEARELKARLAEVEAELRDAKAEAWEEGLLDRLLREEQDRSIKAEAESNRLRARLAEVEAALDRVRDLCAQVDADEILLGLTDSTYVLAAIDGTWLPSPLLAREGDRPAEPGVWPGGGIAFSKLRPAAGTDGGEGDR